MKFEHKIGGVSSYYDLIDSSWIHNGSSILSDLIYQDSITTVLERTAIFNYLIIYNKFLAQESRLFIPQTACFLVHEFFLYLNVQ